MDSVLSCALAGAPPMHLQTQRTFMWNRRKICLFFSLLKSTLNHRSGSRIKFHSTIKKKPQPINEHEISELKCTDPSEAGDEESRLEVMFAQ